MKITISEIKEEGKTFKVHETIYCNAVSDEIPISAEIQALKDGVSVFLSGKINAQVAQPCSRCLENYDLKMEIAASAVYLPEVDKIENGELHELTPKELDTGFYREDQIDLKAFICEQILINLPMRPVCSEQCEGLCSICGINLNTAKCNCKVESIDDRWKALKDITIERKD